MNFSTLAHAKLNLSFDQELFIKEYDERIYPKSFPISAGVESINRTIKLNQTWNMVDPNIYEQINTNRVDEKGVYTPIDRGRKSWVMRQLLELDTTAITNPVLLKFASIGGVGLRNAAYQHNFKVKEDCKDLQIVDWIYKNLPFEKIVSIHCVAIDPDGFAPIHRDDKSLFDNKSSVGTNLFYKNNFVIININISSGGVPLCWGLDMPNADNCYKADDAVYLTNDYFLHGVPQVTSRRRQIRVSGIPKPEMYELFDKQSIVDVGNDYIFNPLYPG
jgi:hypothetical protein